MEVMYQRRCANYIYQVPEGLKELMSDISREVLRQQPTELYAFIADYLEALMITRENARVAAKTISNIAEASEVIGELMKRTKMSQEQANKVVLVIQKAFRKHMRHRQSRHSAIEQEPLLEKICKKCRISMKQAEKSVVVIQRAYRQFRLRREAEQLSEQVDWKTAFFSTMRIYKKSGATQVEMNKAATLIKAAYKGYYTRRVVRKFLAETSIPEAHEEFYPVEGEEQELAVHTTSSWDVMQGEFFRQTRAAIIIQRMFRQWLAMKHRMMDATLVFPEEQDLEGYYGEGDHAILTEEIERKSTSEPLKKYVESEGFKRIVEEIRLSSLEISLGEGSGLLSQSTTFAAASPTENTGEDMTTPRLPSEFTDDEK